MKIQQHQLTVPMAVNVGDKSFRSSVDSHSEFQACCKDNFEVITVLESYQFCLVTSYCTTSREQCAIPGWQTLCSHFFAAEHKTSLIGAIEAKDMVQHKNLGAAYRSSPMRLAAPHLCLYMLPALGQAMLLLIGSYSTRSVLQQHNTLTPGLEPKVSSRLWRLRRS